MGWRGGVLWMIVVLPAIVLCAQHWQELSENASDRILAADNILMMALSFLVLKALHELGHGYAVKAFGGIVHEIGIMFLVFAPMPYVDASAASEFRSKWQRAFVGAAGMIVEVFIAALALVCVARGRAGTCPRIRLQCHAGRRHFDGSIQWQSAFAV